MFPTLAACLAVSGTLVAAQVAYIDPRINGGSMLTLQDEPLNLIISALSSPTVLDLPGLINYANALGYATDCLGISLGGPQASNLGDGNGWVNQTFMAREDYGLPIGSCLETLIGGNHYRVFPQNGPTGSGALFCAASREDPITESHDIVPNGYNIGRDQVVATATGGIVSFSGVQYSTTAEYVSGLLPVGAMGINHNISIDGQVAVLTVTASTIGSGLDCEGSSLCGLLSAASCDAAAALIVPTQIYRTDMGAAATGECSGHCGFFVQGTNCQFTGATMLEAYADIRGNNCQKCGSKRYTDGCLITINYVSSC